MKETLPKRLRRIAAVIATVPTLVVVWASIAAAQEVPDVEQPTVVEPPGNIGGAVSTVGGWIFWGCVTVAAPMVICIAILMMTDLGDRQTRSTWISRLVRVIGGLILAGSAAAVVNQLT